MELAPLFGSMPDLNPEQLARRQIDAQLGAAGWVVQDHKAVDLSTGRGIALREVPLTTGPCDHLLFVDRKALGVIEAKRRPVRSRRQAAARSVKAKRSPSRRSRPNRGIIRWTAAAGSTSAIPRKPPAAPCRWPRRWTCRMTSNLEPSGGTDPASLQPDIRTAFYPAAGYRLESGFTFSALPQLRSFSPRKSDDRIRDRPSARQHGLFAN